jgi:hypothetical protein
MDAILDFTPLGQKGKDAVVGRSVVAGTSGRALLVAEPLGGDELSWTPF